MQCFFSFREHAGELRQSPGILLGRKPSHASRENPRTPAPPLHRGTIARVRWPRTCRGTAYNEEELGQNTLSTNTLHSWNHQNIVNLPAHLCLRKNDLRPYIIRFLSWHKRKPSSSCHTPHFHLIIGKWQATGGVAPSNTFPLHAVCNWEHPSVSFALLL